MSWFGSKISVAAGLVAAAVVLPAHAQTITDDPLHGFCFQAAPLCKDGGAFTPLTQMTGSNKWGFDIDPQTATGDYKVEFLIPDNVSGAGTSSFGTSSIVLSATNTSGNPIGPTTLKGGGAQFNSGDLSTFVGLSGSKPANMIGAYTPYTSQIDPGFKGGYFVYEVDLNTNTLVKNTQCTTPSPDNCGPLLTLAANLPTGSFVTGFLDEGGKNGVVATAPSGSLLFTGNGPIPHNVPEPAAWSLIGVGLAGLAVLRRRKRTSV